MTGRFHLPGVNLSAAGVEPLARTWNQVARVGKFEGHPQGPFEFTPEVFDVIVKNFDATANGRVPVDYEHASEALPENYAQEGVPALAWIVKLENRAAEGLWGLFEWVDPTAVGYVRAGKYMYLSPAVVFAAVDRATGAEIGPRLTSAALTNHPFLDGMEPLVASDRAPAVAQSLPADAVHVPGAIGAPQGKVKPMAEEQKDSQESNRVMAMLKKLRARMKMAEDADEEAVMGEFGKRMDALEQLQKEDGDRKMSDARATVARRCSALPDAGREHALRVCLADRAAFDAMFPEPPQGRAPEGDARTLLTNRATPADGAPPSVLPETLDDVAGTDHSAAADALATKLMSENPKLAYRDAVVRASAQLRQQETDAALRRMNGKV